VEKGKVINSLVSRLKSTEIVKNKPSIRLIDASQEFLVPDRAKVRLWGFFSKLMPGRRVLSMVMMKDKPSRRRWGSGTGREPRKSLGYSQFNTDKVPPLLE
jgi:hypothetical protein